ncbi:MAG: heme-binding protein [Desulfuromonadales bacterium]|nr:heme-binding protein [Desulfuromonadales bacterium]NIS44388.1 heme-binding protein [Desulfuromonadales bacterium]
MAYEEPDYTVLETYDSFELRRYVPFWVAETLVSDEFDEAGSRAFRRLFGFIKNDERPEGKIAMTVPVIQQPVAQEKASSPGSRGEALPAEQPTTYRFAFFMPSEYTREELPTPADESIRIRQTASRVLAARRYSGTWSEDLYRENEKILLEAVEAAGLKMIGEPIFARYNAPFSLWFLRRNEVLVEVEAP